MQSHHPLPPQSALVEASRESLRQWRLMRRCALAPNELVFSYLLLVALSLLIALPFGWLGLWMVPLCVLFQLALAGAMYLVHMIHAADGEQITFSPDGYLSIDVVRGFRTRRYRMNALWTHFERGGARNERLWLCSCRLRVEVATQIPQVDKKRVEKELKRALAEAQSGCVNLTFGGRA